MDQPILHFPTKRTAAETAEILGMSIATLARERQRKRIRAYVAGNRRIYYLDHEIEAYFERRTESWDEKSSSEAGSEIIGSQGNLDRSSGIAHGSIEALDKRDAKRSALKILNAPTSCSRNGSRSTSSCGAPKPKT
jgi:hypothetical protein